MKISSFDYFFGNLFEQRPTLGIALGKLESAIFVEKLRNEKIFAPVFVMGLARSGTTAILEILHNTGAFSSYQYRDYPFATAPIFWELATKWIMADGEPVERPHQDDVLISPNSPEAFEEVIWRAFFLG